MDESIAEENNRKREPNKAIFETCRDPGCPVEKGGLPHGHLINVERADEYAGPVHVVLPAEKPAPQPMTHKLMNCTDVACPIWLESTKGHSHLRPIDEEKPDPIEAIATLKAKLDSLPDYHGSMIINESPVTSWLSIPLEELMQLVADYTSWVETAETKEVCKCEWIIHPDDINKKPEEGKRRMRRGDTSLDCPAHTKEGYLLGFFEWLKRDVVDPQLAADIGG